MKPIQHLSLRKPQTWESGTHQRGRTDTYCNLRVTIIGHGNQNGLFDHIIQRISICTSVAIVQLDYNSTISGYFCSPSFSLHTERMQLRLSCYRALLVVSFCLRLPTRWCHKVWYAIFDNIHHINDVRKHIYFMISIRYFIYKFT